MPTISSALADVQTYVLNSIKHAQNNLKMDAATQDKVHAVALVVMKAIALIAISAAIGFFGYDAITSLSSVAPFFSGSAVIATVLALSVLGPASKDPSYFKEDSDAIAKEGSKEAPSSGRDLKSISKSWHENQDSNYAKEGDGRDLENVSRDWHDGKDSNYAEPGIR